MFLQNSKTAGLFYLQSGIVDLWRTNQHGHELIVHRASSGESFAEASLFSETFHCSASARMESVVVEIHRHAILRKLQSDIAFSNQLVHKFAQQIQTGRRKVELLSIRVAEDRIMAALLDGFPCQDIGSFAQLIGLAPETVYRGLAKLTKTKKIKKLAHGHYQLVQ